MVLDLDARGLGNRLWLGFRLQRRLCGGWGALRCGGSGGSAAWRGGAHVEALDIELCLDDREADLQALDVAGELR